MAEKDSSGPDHQLQNPPPATNGSDQAWEEKKQRISKGGGGGGNVLVNGRTAVHAGSGGVLTTVDVCKTKIGKPVVPIAYTNIARSTDAALTAGSIIINGNPACHKQSIFARSTGDEPGNRLGVASGTICAQAEFITAASTVFFENVPAVRQGDLMVSNNKNTPPMPLVQPGAAAPPSLALDGAETQAGDDLPDSVEFELAGDEMHFVKGMSGDPQNPPQKTHQGGRQY